MTEPYITEPGEYDLDEAVYHADPVVGGSLSSTGARTLITSSPARFDYLRHHPRPDTAAFDYGRAAHTHVLGVGAPIAEIKADDWRTKNARADRDAARAAGLTPLLEKDATRVYEMAEALRRHPVAGPLLARAGRAERSFVARDPESGVLCRIRVDWMPEVKADSRVLVVDYKSTTNAHPVAFARAMADHGYHLQGPFYCDALSWLGLDNAREPKFVLIAQEKDRPYLVTVGSPSTRAIEWGRVLNRKARDTYRACTEAGVWPGYGGADPVVFDLPGWLDHQYDAAYDAGAYDTTSDLIGDLTA
jgi:hypothetical protein